MEKLSVNVLDWSFDFDNLENIIITFNGQEYKQEILETEDGKAYIIFNGVIYHFEFPEGE